MKYIVNPGIGVPKTMKEMKMYCDYFNEIGKRCQQNGMKLDIIIMRMNFRK